MSRNRRRDQDEQGIFPVDLTPMIDIVFLLLIFFMVSTRFLEPHGFRVDLPETREAPTQSGQTDLPVLLVRPEGGAVWLQQEYPAGGQLPPELPDGVAQAAVLRADRRASHGQVMHWLDELQSIGVTSVTLSAAPLEKGRLP